MSERVIVPFHEDRLGSELYLIPSGLRDLTDSWSHHRGTFNRDTGTTWPEACSCGQIAGITASISFVRRAGGPP